MTSAAVLLASVSLGLALTGLAGGDRRSFLRELGQATPRDPTSRGIRPTAGVLAPPAARSRTDSGLAERSGSSVAEVFAQRTGPPIPEVFAQRTSKGPLAQIQASHWRVGLLAGLVCWLLVGPGLIGAVMGFAAIPGSMVALAWLEAAPQRRRTRALVAQLPGCLDLLGAALAAGVPLRAAVRHVARLVPEPSASVLAGVLGHLDIGRSDAQAWVTLRGHPVWGQTARDLARCADSGAAVAEILAVHAEEARARRRALREAAARTVGVRSVLPLVCCFLPAFVLVGVVPIIAATISTFTQGR